MQVRRLAFGIAPAYVMLSCSLLTSLDGLTGGVANPDASTNPTRDAAVTSADVNVADVDVPDTAPTVDSSLPVESGDAGATEGGDTPACTPPAPALLDNCTGLLAMPKAPVIDGVLDCGMPLWDMPLAGWSGAGSVPSGIKTQIAAAWRPDGLYFFVHVTGAGAHRYPAPAASDGQWCGDAVELFADDDAKYSNPPAYDNPGTMQFIIVAPSDSMSSTKVGEMFRDETDDGPWLGQFVSVRTADGFDVEAFVVASDLGLTTWSLAKSGQVGLNVAVDLGNPTQQPASCPALGQYDIQLPQTDAACGRASCNVYEFCDSQLQ